MVAQLVSLFFRLYETPKTRPTAAGLHPASSHCTSLCLAQLTHLNFLPSAPKFLLICLSCRRFVLKENVGFLTFLENIWANGVAVTVRRRSNVLQTVCLPHEGRESPDVPTRCFPFKGDALHCLHVALRSVPNCCCVWRLAERSSSPVAVVGDVIVVQHIADSRTVCFESDCGRYTQCHCHELYLSPIPAVLLYLCTD